MLKSKHMSFFIIFSLIILSAVFFYACADRPVRAMIDGKKLNLSSDSLIYETNKDINYRIYKSRIIDTYIIASALYLDFKSQTLLPNTQQYALYVKAKEHFLPYKEHEFIKNFGKYVFNDDINGDAIGILLSCSNTPELKPMYKFQKRYMNGTINSQKEIDEFLRQLRSFYKDSKAEEFFNQNDDLYMAMEFYIKDNMEKTDIVKIIKEAEKYVGNKEKYYTKDVRYETLLTLFRPSIASFYSITSDNKTILISFQSPNDYSRSPEKFDIRTMISNTIHEFLHSYINTPVENENGLITELTSSKDKKDYAADPMYLHMPWNRIVDENFVRAVHARIYKKAFGEERAMKEIIEIQVKFGGFKHLKSIYDELEMYENKRHKYAMLDDFIPELIKTLFK